MTKLYPVTIVQARYGGTYEGGQWLAFNALESCLPEDWEGSDTECMEFWDRYDRGETEHLIGKGSTPNDALTDLEARVAVVRQEAHNATLAGYPGYSHTRAQA